MEWVKVVVKWINAVKLPKIEAVTALSDLQDGQFFVQVLESLFEKPQVNCHSVFLELAHALSDLYLPLDWIDFNVAQEGNENELLKIVSVIIGIHPFQEGAHHFTTTAADQLCGDGDLACQVLIRDLILIVMKNGNLFTSEAEEFIQNINKTSIGHIGQGHPPMEPRVLFPRVPPGTELTPSPPSEAPQDLDKDANVYSYSPCINANGPSSHVDSPLQHLFMSTPFQNKSVLLSAARNDVESYRRKVSSLENWKKELEESLEEENKRKSAVERKLETEISAHKKTKNQLETLRTENLDIENRYTNLLELHEKSDLQLTTTKLRLTTAVQDLTAIQERSLESENKIRALESQLSSSKVKLSRIEAMLEATETRATEAEELVETRNGALEVYQHKQRDLIDRIRTNEDELAECQHRLAFVTSGYNAAKVKVQNYEEEFNSMKTQLLETEFKLQELQTRIGVYEESLTVVRDALCCSESSLKVSRAALSDKQHTILILERNFQMSEVSLKATQGMLEDKLITIEHFVHALDMSSQLFMETDAALLDKITVIDNLEKDLERAQITLNVLQIKLAEKENNVEDLREENSVLLVNHEKTVERLKVAYEEADVAHRLELESYQQEIESQRSTIEKQENELQTHVTEICGLNTKIHEFEIGSQKSLEGHQLEVEAYRNQIENQRSVIEKQENEHQTHVTEICGLNTKIHEFEIGSQKLGESHQLEVEAYQNQIESQRSTIEKQENELQTHVTEICGLNTKIHEFDIASQKSLESHQLEVEAYRNQIESQRSTIEKQENELQTHVTEICGLNTKIHEFEIGSQKLRESHQLEVEAYQNQIESQRSTIEKQENELQTHVTEICGLNTKIHEFEIGSQKLRESHQLEVEAYQNQIESQRSTIEKQENELQTHVTEICGLNTKIHEFEIGSQKLRESHQLEVEAYQNQIESQRSTIEKQENELQTHVTEICGLNTKIHEFEIGSQKLRESHQLEVEAYRNQIGGQRSSLEHLENEIKSLRTENERLDTALQAVDETARATKLQIQENAIAKFNALKQQMIETCRKEVEYHKDQAEDLKREKAQLRAKNIELANSNYGLENLKKEQEMKHRKLQEQYNGHLRTCQSLLPNSSEFDRMEDSMRFNSFLESTRRLSIGSIQSNGSGRTKVVPDGSGSLFPCDDEEEFPYNENNFEEQMGRSGFGGGAGIRESHGGANSVAEVVGTDEDRISELQRRNTLVLPHLRSVYSVEYATLPQDVRLNEQQLRAPVPATTFSKSVSAPNIGKGQGQVKGPGRVINVSKMELRGPTPKKYQANTENRAPFSPTSAHVNGGSAAQAQRHMPFSGSQKTKSDSVLTPRKKTTSANSSAVTSRGRFYKNLF